MSDVGKTAGASLNMCCGNTRKCSGKAVKSAYAQGATESTVCADIWPSEKRLETSHWERGGCTNGLSDNSTAGQVRVRILTVWVLTSEIQGVRVCLSLWVYLCVTLDAWKDLALLRAKFSPQAGDHAFFLPWHRYFLRLVERELQSVSSCKLAIPYFEWTVDTGSMNTSTAWQADLFGGDGEPGSGCVPHHPFQGTTSHWSPCLRRRFNSSVGHSLFNCSPFTFYPLQCYEISGLRFLCIWFLLLPLGVAAKCSEPTKGCKPCGFPALLPVSANLFWPF